MAYATTAPPRMNQWGYLIIPTIGEPDTALLEHASPSPPYNTLKKLIGRHFDEPFEHVSVLYEGKRHDMFVGETSACNGRHIRNIRATEIYRNNTLTNEPETNPESLPAISGPALLFLKRIWF